MTNFRRFIFEEPKTPQEGLMRLAEAIGRYEANRDLRKEKAEREQKQNAAHKDHDETSGSK